MNGRLPRKQLDMAPKQVTSKVKPTDTAALTPRASPYASKKSSGPSSPGKTSGGLIPVKKGRHKKLVASLFAIVFLGALFGVLYAASVFDPPRAPTAPPAPPPPCDICEVNTKVRVSLAGVTDLNAVNESSLKRSTVAAIDLDDADVKIDDISYAPRGTVVLTNVTALFFRSFMVGDFTFGASDELQVSQADVEVENVLDVSVSSSGRRRLQSDASVNNVTVQFKIASIRNSSVAIAMGAKVDAMMSNTNNTASPLRAKMENHTGSIATAVDGEARVDVDYVVKFEKPSAYDPTARDFVESAADKLEAAASSGALKTALDENGVMVTQVIGTKRLPPEPPDQDEPETLGPPPEFVVPLISSGECLSSDAIVPEQWGMALRAVFEDEVFGWVDEQPTKNLVRVCELDENWRTNWDIPLFDDGTHGDPVAGDGWYTNLCLKACPGENGEGFLKNFYEDGDFAAIGGWWPLGGIDFGMAVISPRLRGSIPVENVGRGWGASPNYINATVATSHAFFSTMTDEAAMNWPSINSETSRGSMYYMDAWSMFGIMPAVKWCGDQFDYYGWDFGTNHKPNIRGSYQRLKDWMSGISTFSPQGYNIDYDGYLPKRLMGVYTGGNSIATDTHELAHGVLGASLGETTGKPRKYFGCQSGRCNATEIDMYDIKMLQEDNQHFPGRCTVTGQLHGGLRAWPANTPTGTETALGITLEAHHDADGHLTGFEYVDYTRYGEPGLRDANQTNGTYYANRVMDSFQLYYAGLMSLQQALELNVTYHCIKAGPEWTPDHNNLEDGMNGRAGNYQNWLPPPDKYTTFKVKDLYDTFGARCPPAPYNNPFSRGANTVEGAHVLVSRRYFSEAERAYWTLYNRYMEDDGLATFTHEGFKGNRNADPATIPRKWGFGSMQYPVWYTWKAATADVGRKRTRIDRVPCGTDAAFRPLSCFPDLEAEKYPLLPPLVNAPPPPPANEQDIYQRYQSRMTWLPSERPTATKECAAKCQELDYCLDNPVTDGWEDASGIGCGAQPSCGRGCLYAVQSADRAECDRSCVDMHRKVANWLDLGDFDIEGRQTSDANGHCGPKDVTNRAGCLLATGECPIDPKTGAPCKYYNSRRKDSCRSGCEFHFGLSEKEKTCIARCKAEGYPENIARHVSCGGVVNCEQGCMWASELGSQQMCDARCAEANAYGESKYGIPACNPRNDICWEYPWRGPDYISHPGRYSPQGEELYKCNFDIVSETCFSPSLCGNEKYPGSTSADRGDGKVFAYDDIDAAKGFCAAGCGFYEHADATIDPCGTFSEYRPLWCFGAVKPGADLHGPNSFP